MESFKKPKAERIETIVTHSGPFHTDEVFATAILKDLFPEEMQHADGSRSDYVKYIRTRDKTTLDAAHDSPSDLVIDVGMEYDIDAFNLDHHQKGGAGARENGIEYATAGLVWKHYGREWIKYIDVYTRALGLSESEIEFVWKSIDENYVQFVDGSDTGQMNDVAYSMSNGESIKGGQFTMPELVRLYNVDTRDGRTPDQRFKDVVEVYRNLTLAMVHKQIDLIDGIRSFDMDSCEFSSDGRTVIIDKETAPVVTSYLMQERPEFQKTEFFAAVNLRGAYNIIVVPKGEKSRESRNPNMIPQELRLGKDEAAINAILGIEDGAVFVHNAGFMAAVKNREAAKIFLDKCRASS